MTPKGFHNKMIKSLDEYQEYLLLEKPKETVVSHCSILHEFFNYLYNFHLVSGIEQITVSMANSKFQTDFRRRNKTIVTKELMKKILNDFFVFFYCKYGINNEKLMRGLAR
jgi:hypothetical protein